APAVPPSPATPRAITRPGRGHRGGGDGGSRSSGGVRAGSPRFERNVRPGFRSEPQHVAVRVGHLHLVGPVVVLRRVKDPGPARPVLVEQYCYVIHANPNPGARLPLPTLAEVDAGSIAGKQ